MKPPPDPWQEFTRRWLARRGWIGAIATLLLLAVPAQSADDEEEKEVEQLSKENAELARKYAAVVGWRGFFQSSETGAISWTGFYSAGAETVEIASHGQFTLERSEHWSGDDVRRGVMTWKGGNNKTVCGERTVSYDRQVSKWDFKGTGSETRTQASGSLPMTATEFTIWLPTLKRNSTLVHVHPGGGSNGKTIARTLTGRSVWDENQGNGKDVRRTRSLDETSQTDSFVTWYGPVGEAADAAWHQVMRAGPGVLVFPFESTTRADTQISTSTLTRRSRVILCPIYDDLELEVTMEGYSEWRPKGSIEKPHEPGNHLVARATVISKTGAAKSVPDVKRFRFELMDTSREPGICLNWPLKAKDEDYDLRLTSERGGKLSDKDQKLIVTEAMKDDKGRPYAETKIDSYDFGGRATMLVVCELEDGRELMGVVKGEKGEDGLVRLPKMEGPDWIAENWRKEKKAEKLPALDDDEKVDGQEHKGDGFTLYEEYRGWVERGEHIEGDPLKKDFFVRNTIGADAKGGIALFKHVSKLRVHSDLRASEIVVLDKITDETESKAAGERIMNLNRRDGPHRVDQHAVVMINTRGYGSRGGGTDAVADNNKTNRAFRPGKVQVIHVEDRSPTDGVFSRKASIDTYKLSESDAALVYHRAVAHELLHSVGVDHHGEGESPKTYYFQGAGDPTNTLHRPRFVPYMPSSKEDFGKKADRPETWKDFDRGPTITLKWEDTGEDLAQSISADFERELTAERRDPFFNHDGAEQAAKYPQYGRDAAYWSEMSIYSAVSGGATKRGIRNPEAHRFDRFVTVGRKQEADSGNELCLMRYYFADAYPIDGVENAFYLVRPGKNRAGLNLCRSPEGTGANGSGHKPQPRFGDSAPGRGNCFKYICPNDAIPPRNL